tara:strand:- start:2201 stop:2581 length:381 start_codon:yes stop_codon:yes gene_type:complete
MSTCAIIENNTLFNLRENEYINTLIRENDTLKFNNNKLYRRTVNLKRKNLRLKKMLSNNLTLSEETVTSTKPILKTKYILDDDTTLIDEVSIVNNESILNDVVWEDVNDLIQSYEIEDKIQNISEI